MLKARPNQIIPSKKVKTIGSTRAASTISVPSHLPSMRISFSIAESDLPDHSPYADKKNCKCHCHTERNLGGLRAVQRDFRTGHAQSEKSCEHLDDITQRLQESPLPDHHYQ